MQPFTPALTRPVPLLPSHAPPRHGWESVDLVHTDLAGGEVQLLEGARGAADSWLKKVRWVTQGVNAPSICVDVWMCGPIYRGEMDEKNMKKCQTYLNGQTYPAPQGI